MLAFVAPVALAAPDADPPGGEAPPVAPAEVGAPSLALSVGTGPRPLNTLTGGLSGMGARILLPGTSIFPWFGGAYHMLSSREAYRDDAFVTNLSAATVSLGVRGELGGDDFAGVDPYVVAGLFGSRAGYRSGDHRFEERSSVLTVGATAAFGLEGFLTEHLSVGAEIGGTVGRATGIGEAGDASGWALSTLSAAQLTVWR